jgi:heptose I phosphotransferase
MMRRLWHRLTRGEARVLMAPEWPEFAGPDWQRTIMERPVSDRFHAKQGRSTGRLHLFHGDRTLSIYLKRHYRLPWWRGLMATLLPGAAWSPAFEEYHHLQWARALGLPVPDSVAAGETIGPWGQLQSFLAVAELRDMLPLHEAIPLAFETLPSEAFRRWKVGLITELVRLVRLLHDRRTCHQDLYLCHFYLPRPDTGRVPAAGDWPGRLHVIDFHRLAHRPLGWPIWQVKDLAQLLYSSDVAGIEPRDRARFWRAYRQGQRGIAAAWLAWAIRLKGARYRRHNARSRTIGKRGAAA